MDPAAAEMGAAAEVWGDSTSMTAVAGVLAVLVAFVTVAGLAVYRYVQAGVPAPQAGGAGVAPGGRRARRGMARMVAEAQEQDQG